MKTKIYLFDFLKEILIFKRVNNSQMLFVISDDLALLVDTSHPMIRPELERALDQARKIIQSRGKFCIQVDRCMRLKLYYHVITITITVTVIVIVIITVVFVSHTILQNFFENSFHHNE